MNNVDILEEPKDILFKIDMKLYDEFNDKFCEIEENLGTVYSYKDLEDLKKAESDTERTLLREAISTLIAENKELKEKVKAYETECRRFKAFCKKIRKDEKHDVDLFNQGQEQKCNEFLNLIEGEQHWNYEGKYFDETDKQIEDMKQSLLGKE